MCVLVRLLKIIMPGTKLHTAYPCPNRKRSYCILCVCFNCFLCSVLIGWALKINCLGLSIYQFWFSIQEDINIRVTLVYTFHRHFLFGFVCSGLFLSRFSCIGFVFGLSFAFPAFVSVNVTLVRMSPWWSLCIYSMPDGVVVGDSGLCCCVPVQCVTSIFRAQLLPIDCWFNSTLVYSVVSVE